MLILFFVFLWGQGQRRPQKEGCNDTGGQLLKQTPYKPRD